MLTTKRSSLERVPAHHRLLSVLTTLTELCRSRHCVRGISSTTPEFRLGVWSMDEDGRWYDLA
jgi:hypothetical protein